MRLLMVLTGLLALAASCGEGDKANRGGELGSTETGSQSAAICSEDAAPIDGTPTDVVLELNAAPPRQGCLLDETILEHCDGWYLGRCPTFEESLSWYIGQSCSGSDERQYYVFSDSDENGAQYIFVFDASQSLVAYAHTRGLDFGWPQYYCCSGEERSFIYLGNYPEVDCSIGSETGALTTSELDTGGPGI
jgi:hypothetical protein